MYGGTEAKSSIEKSSQIAFVNGGMKTMSVNSGGFRTKMASGSLTALTERLSGSAQPPSRCNRGKKTTKKEPYCLKLP